MLEFINTTLGYNRHPVVHHLTANIEDGDSVAIIGPNGGGKSTLLKGIMSFIKPIDGKILCSVDRKQIAYLPQSSTIDKTFPLSTIELVATGLWHSRGWFKHYSSDDIYKIQDAIRMVHLHGMENEPLKSLSGGQMQRALFARLILQNAQLILLDEPFNSIDIKTTNELIEIVDMWKNEHRTVLAILHNFSQAKEHFSKTLIVSREIIGYGLTSTTLTQDKIVQAFSTDIYPHINAEICRR